MTSFTSEYWGERRVFAYEEITVNGFTYMACGVKSDYTETHWYASEIEPLIKTDFGGLELALVEYDLR